MNNTTPKKANYGDLINYPILLLSISVILNLKNCAFSIIDFFNTVITHPTSIGQSVISLVEIFFPAILLVLLVLHGMGKLNNANRIVGIFIIIAGAISIYYPIITLVRNPSFFTNIFDTPLVSCIVEIITAAFSIWSGVMIFKAVKPNKAFIATFGIMVYLFAVAAIFAVVTSISIISLLKSLLFVMMCFNLPNLFNESTKNKTVITKKKIMVLAIVVAVVLCVYAVADDAIHGGHNDSNRSENTCGSCGRSWEAGDPSKNYINIAKTGLCNNCENNYHSMKQFLDEQIEDS